MNIQDTKIFDIAAKVGIFCLLIMVVGVLSMFIAETLFFRNGDFAGFSPLQPIFVVIALLFGVCVFVLWIEGWIWAIADWKLRSLELNIAMTLFLIIGPAFAAYILHYWKRHHQRI